MHRTRRTHSDITSLIPFVKTNFQPSKDQKPEVRPRSQESRPRSASRTKAKSPLSPEDRLIPPSQRRKRKSNQDEGEAEESEKENEDSPAQKKQKVRTKIVTNPYDLLT